MVAINDIARAKVNLSLKILGRRADGYHDLQSLIFFADLGDRLELEPGPELILKIEGPYASVLDASPDNLILQAARLFLEAFPQAEAGAFTLHKALPVASGLGGGSADAASALRCLLRVNGMEFGDHEEVLNSLALELGADVPVCLTSRPAFVTGLGENIEHLDDMSELHAVLVNPDIPLPTASIFAALGLVKGQAYSTPAPLPAFSGFDHLLTYVIGAENDLEAPACTIAPEILEAKQALTSSSGCLTARMSGSGATCFGIFSSKPDARSAASQISQHHPAWWVASAILG